MLKLSLITMMMISLGSQEDPMTLDLCCPLGFERIVERTVIAQSELKRCRADIKDVKASNKEVAF